MSSAITGVRVVVDAGMDEKWMKRLASDRSSKLYKELLKATAREMKTHARHQRMKEATKAEKLAFVAAKQMMKARVERLEETAVHVMMEDYAKIEDEVLSSKSGQKLTGDFRRELREWFMNRYSFPAEMRGK